ncbi:MAG TPA: hypothetical protein VNL98_07220 [Gemmatimonadales bacterium]|nr:hypothetical protein [Gemmatimonadales bacterium]
MRWLIVVVLLTVAYACGSEDKGAPVDRVLAEIVAENPCPQHPVPHSVRTGMAGAGVACSLVAAAVGALARGESVPGGHFSPGDTALVDSATVDLMVERDASSDSVVAEFWVVTLNLRSRAYNVEMRVNRASGLRTLGPVHKPL